MNIEKVYQELSLTIDKKQILQNEPMKKAHNI